MRLSHPQRRLLLALLRKQAAYSHCKTRSDYGGLHGTLMWAARAGYVTHAGMCRDPKLTQKGLALAKTL